MKASLREGGASPSASQLMFAAMSRLKQPNSVLTQRLLKLLKNFFAEPAQPDQAKLHGSANQRQSVDLANKGLPDETTWAAHSCAHPPYRWNTKAKLSPKSMDLLLSFMTFLGECPYALNHDLRESLQLALKISFTADFKGYANAKRVRAAFIKRVGLALSQGLQNCELCGADKAIILEFLNCTQSPFFRGLEITLHGSLHIEERVVGELARDEIESISHLASYLTVVNKRELVQRVLDSLKQTQSKTGQQTCSLRSQLRILAQLLTTKSQTQGDETSVALLDRSSYDELQSICFQKFHQLFQGALKSEHAFNEFASSHCPLLFKLVSSVQAEHLGGSVETGTQQLTLTELFSTIIKKCFLKFTASITVDQLKCILNVLFDACHALLLRDQSRGSREVADLLETLAVLCTSLNLSGLSQARSESFLKTGAMRGSTLPRLLEEQTTLAGSETSSPLADNLAVHMRGLPLFEEALAQLVHLEISTLLQCSEQNEVFEGSASRQFVTKLVRVAGTMSPSDPNMIQTVSFAASLMQIVVQMNQECLAGRTLSQLEEQVAVLSKLALKCFAKQLDKDDLQLSYLENVLRLRLSLIAASMYVGSKDSIDTFLDELRSLYQRRCLFKTFPDAVVMLCDLLQETFAPDAGHKTQTRTKHYNEAISKFVEFIVQVWEQNPILPSRQLLIVLDSIAQLLTSGSQEGESKTPSRLKERSQAIDTHLKQSLCKLWLLITLNSPNAVESAQVHSALSQIALLTPLSTFSEQSEAISQIQSHERDLLEANCSQFLQQYGESGKEAAREKPASEVLSPLDTADSSQKASKRLQSSTTQHTSSSSQTAGQQQLGQTEKIYFGLFTKVMALKMQAGVSSTHSGSLVENALAAFESETGLVVVDFDHSSSAGVSTELCLKLQQVTKQLLSDYVQTAIATHFETVSELAHQFNVLVAFSCSQNTFQSDLSRCAMAQFSQRFPQLILARGVLANFVTLLSTLHQQIDSNSDCLAYPLNGSLKVKLAATRLGKVEALKTLASTLETMVVAGCVLNMPASLRDYQQIKVDFSERGNGDVKSSFGLVFLDKLIGQLDLNRQDTGLFFEDFASLRRLAVTDPEQFTSIVKQHLCPSALKQKPGLSFTQSSLAELDILLDAPPSTMVKPFQIMDSCLGSDGNYGKDHNTKGAQLIKTVQSVCFSEVVKSACSLKELAWSLKNDSLSLQIFIQSLPQAAHLIAQQLVSLGSKKKPETKKGQILFCVGDKVKSAIQQLSNNKTQTQHLQAGNKDLGLQASKLRRVRIKRENLKDAEEELDNFLEAVFCDEVWQVLSSGSSSLQASQLAQTLVVISRAALNSSRAAQSKLQTSQACFKLLRASLLILESQQNHELAFHVAQLLQSVMLTMHGFNPIQQTRSGFIALLRLIEEVKRLLSRQENSLAVQWASLRDVSLLAHPPHDTSRSFAALGEATRHPHTMLKQGDSGQCPLVKFSIVALHTLQQTLLANFERGGSSQGSLSSEMAPVLSQSDYCALASRFPKLSLVLATRHPAQFSGLIEPVTKVIETEPHRFTRDPDALHLYFSAKLRHEQTLDSKTLETLAFWRPQNTFHLSQFLSYRHEALNEARQLALKPLRYADSESVIFCLPQLFQSLRWRNPEPIADFLITQSLGNAAIAHNVLWFCKVESELEQGPGRKVPLPVTETLHTKAHQLYKTLLVQLSPVQRAFFETETDFFQKITSISGLLQPSQSKDEKKAIIKQKLIEYNQEIPTCVYLPTNQTCKVVGIVTDSGQPMQSAARVPILISFEVESYAGPDRDPILHGDSIVAQLVRNSPQVAERQVQPLSRKKELNWETELDRLADCAGEDSKGADDQTLCDQLENYQMQIKDNKLNFLSSSNSEEKKFTEEPKQLIKADFIPQVDSPTKAQAIENREQFLQALTSQLSSDKSTFGRKKSSLLMVQKMLQNKRGQSDALRSSLADKAKSQQAPRKVISCIFKVNDDLRQDILALQVIRLFQQIFKQSELDLYVKPYKCISNRTGSDKLLGGIIEVIPESNSRDQLGKAFEIDLLKYFLKRYGSEQSSAFQRARLNFIRSLAAYCVVSYILQIKDRHNGNIMIDERGHLIHIDFGFIFDWSPGHDMRFESANFKLTQEFIDILGGSPSAEPYQLFVQKVIQGFLAVRKHADEIQNLVELMWYSGFPCFKPASLQKLQYRFRKDLGDLEAATYMEGCIKDAHDKWTTRIYDFIQAKQNKIFF